MKNNKLLYLINSFNSGGAERGVLTLIKSGFFDDVDLHLVAIHKGSGPLFEELKSLEFNSNIHFCDDGENLKITSMLKALLFVVKFLIKERPKYLLLSLTQSKLIGCFVSLLFPRMKVISFLHSASFSKKIYKYLLWILSFRVNACLYDSQKTYIAMKPTLMGSKKRSWHYVPLVCIDIEVQKDIYELNNPIEIFSAGRLNTVKNYAAAIKAVSILKKSGIKLHYVIAGEGEELGDLKALSQLLDVENEVEFLGFVKDWVNVAKNKDIFLMSSVYEGLSIVTVEAMAAGIPVVATNVGEITNYGHHMQNMVKSDSTNAEDIAKSIKLLISDSGLRKKIANQGKEDITHSFSEDRVREINRLVAKDLFD